MAQTSLGRMMAGITAFLRDRFWGVVWELRGRTPDVVASRGGIGITQEQLERCMEYALDLLDLNPATDSVLDVGCGAGYMAERIAPRARQVIAVDRSKRLADRARRTLARFGNAEAFQSEATSIPRPDGSFSKILCYSVVHYFPSRTYFESFLGEVRRLLESGGMALVADVPEKGRLDFSTSSATGPIGRALAACLTYALSPFLHFRCSREEALEIARKLGLSARILDQPSFLIFHESRFDLALTKQREPDRSPSGRT